MADPSEQKPNFPQGRPLSLELGTSWSERKIITIKYDFKPASIDLSNAILQHNADGSVVIKVPDSDGSGNMTTVYTGHSYEPKAGMLNYDKETDKLVLEKINYAYRVKYTRPHNVPSGPDVPNSGDRRKAPTAQVQEVRRPSSSMSSTARQSAAPNVAAPVSRAGGTPSSTSSRRAGRQDQRVVGAPEAEEKPPQVYFMTDSEDENVASSSSSSSSSDGESSSASGGQTGNESGGEAEEDGGSNNNSVESKQEGSLPRPSPDCSSRSSSKHQNTSTRKPQLSSCSSESDVELDDASSNFGPCSSQPERNNSSRDSANNGETSGHFSSIPKGRYVGNLSDSDSDS